MVLGAIVTYGVLVIGLQPIYGALSDRIGRRPINIFSVVFTGLWAFPFFALVQTGEPVLVWIALIVAATIGWAPMIAVQPAFYAELFGARVRYTGFATSRELGAAIAGFSPLIFAALLSANGDQPWLVAAFFVGLAVISLVAFLYSAETKDVDVARDRPRPAGAGERGERDRGTGAHVVAAVRLGLRTLRAHAPRVDPRALEVGIVHLGLGAFHRAHQAVYTEDALAASSGPGGSAASPGAARSPQSLRDAGRALLGARARAVGPTPCA